ncbi:MAG: hypothetical protein KGL39_00575 [Patescibacteria group bacterium]|nr:hypothetical protein [Patescibacteria group bacterium]
MNEISFDSVTDDLLRAWIGKYSGQLLSVALTELLERRLQDSETAAKVRRVFSQPLELLDLDQDIVEFKVY